MLCSHFSYTFIYKAEVQSGTGLGSWSGAMARCGHDNPALLPAMPGGAFAQEQRPLGSMLKLIWIKSFIFPPSAFIQRDAACTGSRSDGLPSSRALPLETQRCVTTSLALLIRDTAKKILVSANSMKALGDRKWSHPCPPMIRSLLSPGVWITSLWRSPRCRAAVDQ